MSALRTCPACRSTQHKSECLLGRLGRLIWYRCRYCGMDWWRESKAKKWVC